MASASCAPRASLRMRTHTLRSSGHPAALASSSRTRCASAARRSVVVMPVICLPTSAKAETMGRRARPRDSLFTPTTLHEASTTLSNLSVNCTTSRSSISSPASARLLRMRTSTVWKDTASSKLATGTLDRKRWWQNTEAWYSWQAPPARLMPDRPLPEPGRPRLADSSHSASAVAVDDVGAPPPPGFEGDGLGEATVATPTPPPPSESSPDSTLSASEGLLSSSSSKSSASPARRFADGAASPTVDF
mmetsp:Transcript_107799/g.344115  ORF Transcript_107799/g.344115 Transcript_107799/m.344115 type:complete len:248 (+) Transcript_107799:880-1623(+)